MTPRLSGSHQLINSTMGSTTKTYLTPHKHVEEVKQDHNNSPLLNNSIEDDDCEIITGCSRMKRLKATRLTDKAEKTTTANKDPSHHFNQTFTKLDFSEAASEDSESERQNNLPIMCTNSNRVCDEHSERQNINSQNCVHTCSWKDTAHGITSHSQTVNSNTVTKNKPESSTVMNVTVTKSKPTVLDPDKENVTPQDRKASVVRSIKFGDQPSPAGTRQ